MKKILMICEAFGGGVFVYVSQLCNDMCEYFDVYLAYAIRPQTPKNYKDFLNRRIHLIEVKNFGKQLLNVWNDRKIIQELQEIQKNIKPDIIHLHSSIAGGLGRLAFREKNSTVIYTPHGYAHILLCHSAKSSIYWVLEKILGRIDHITLTCCESEDEEAKKLCKRTAYIETGVNLQDLSMVLNEVKPVRKKGFTVFTMGRICDQKQPHIFNRIAQMVPEANFLWVGDGELHDVLTAPNIEITGWMSRYEALAIAKSADVFILCSCGEAIAMSLIENMYIKKLCLVSNVMGNKSVIRDGINGYVCNSAEQFAERIRDAMRNFPRILPEMAYTDVIAIYNTDMMKKKFVKFYDNLPQVIGGDCPKT